MKCFRPPQLATTLRFNWFWRRLRGAARAAAVPPVRAVLAVLAALLLLATGPAQAASTTFNGATVAGCTYAASNTTYTCNTLPFLAGGTDSVTVASGYTVIANPSVTFTYNQGLTLSGSAVFASYGNLNIADINPANLNVTGGYLAAEGNFKMGNQAQTITASIYAGSVTLGSGSTTKVTGTIYSTGQVDLGSHVTIVGPVTGTVITTNSPVSISGDVSASTSLTLASGSSVTGNVSGGALTLNPSGTTVTGNVNVSGDVDIGSGDTINGNVTAHNVTTESSNGIITGNASVNAITLNYGGRVQKTITCTGSGASGCSCVTNNSGYNAGSPSAPMCSPPQNPPSTLDHILISYSIPGLTCQPLSVTLKACANAACTSTYTGQVNATFTATPQSGTAGNQNVPFTGTATVNVQQTTATTVTLGATTSNTAQASSCSDGAGGTSCQVPFVDSALLFGTIPDHVSATSAAFTITAVKKSNNAAQCTPAFKGTHNVTLSCAYLNPTQGTMGPSVTGVPLGLCGGSGASVPLSFDNNGVANTTLSYADVGQLSLSATYSGTVADGYPGLAIKGGPSNTFTVAPASIGVAVRAPALPGQAQGTANPGAITATGTVFMAAGKPFTVALSALNSVGAVTPNFGKETMPETFAVTSPTLALSWTSTKDGSGNLPGNNPAISLSNTTLSAGTYTSSALWNEVGSFNLAANLTNASGYLGTNLKAAGAAVVGRFIPDHFGTTLAGNVPMDCKNTSTTPAAPLTFSTLCGAPKFVYSLQPFDVAVTAYAAGGSATQNYQGQLARNVALSLWTAAGGSTATPAAAGTGNGISVGWMKNAATLPASTTLVPADFALGIATTSNTGAQPNLQFASGYVHPPTGNQSPATPGSTSVPAATSTWLRASEPAGGDGVTSLQASGSIEPGLVVTSGRLLVGNNYGAETSPMTVAVKAQYWNGNAWQTNTAFTTAAGVAVAGKLGFDDCKKNLAANAPATVCKNPPLTVSNGTLTFPAAPTTTGAASLTFAAPGGAGGTSLLVSPFPYLPTTVGTLTFGTYRAGPVIYLREVY
ncbi:DUF6701 domain-containing protein [Rugamonas sp.]|uniref:DUF6701 domain-containing protein n=1 Tax=Rugamonas sp. TaxID=1926287 RepID=UPI0025E27D1F|nr:DUF6701 domain-containing protein [Rugamonas sp.]